MLAPGGVLAVQMPYRFRTRAQRALDEVVAGPRWAGKLAGAGLHRDSVKPPAWYVRRLRRLGLEVDAWKTTYYHVLPGDDPVLEWLKGTALRPLLALLGPGEGDAFLAELGRRLREAYRKKDAVALLPFPRIFLVGKRPKPPG
jgi:trans-aconitate 2-methyltransferase